MKKKVIFGAVAALFLGAGIFTSVNLTQKPKMSNLTLANIEAMTIDRFDPDAPFGDCKWEITYHTPEWKDCFNYPKGGMCCTFSDKL